MSRNSHQTGQVMLMGLVLCAAGVLAWGLMLELGRRVHDQSSLNRATDAASYTAALIQARALNLHAYLNRAHIAHQLGMAHIIAVATATQYRARLARQARIRNPPPSLIGTFFGPQHALAYTSALKGGLPDFDSMQTFKDAFLSHERHVHQVIAQVRQSQIKDFERQREQAIHQVLIANVGQSGGALRGDTLEQLGLNVALTLDESQGLVVQHSANTPIWRDFLSTLVEQYDFLSERKHTKRNVWIINPRCPLKRHELRRSGHVRLGRDGQWRSEESLSFHALRYNKIAGCYHREYPMGWAALSTQGSQQNLEKDGIELPDFSRQVFWRWAKTKRSSASLTQLFGRSVETKWVSKGLGHYAALAKGRDDQPVRIALKVSQRLDKHSVITAVSTAQAYFHDPIQIPSRSLPRTQQISPSLFDPYWRATLIPNLTSP
jgi:hypothetical protein